MYSDLILLGYLCVGVRVSVTLGIFHLSEDSMIVVINRITDIFLCNESFNRSNPIFF